MKWKINENGHTLTARRGGAAALFTEYTRASSTRPTSRVVWAVVLPLADECCVRNSMSESLY